MSVNMQHRFRSSSQPDRTFSTSEPRTEVLPSIDNSHALFQGDRQRGENPDTRSRIVLQGGSKCSTHHVYRTVPFAGTHSGRHRPFCAVTPSPRPDTFQAY